MQLLIFSEWMKEKVTLKKDKHCLRGEKNESDFPLINITDMPNFEQKVVLITGKRKAVFFVCFIDISDESAL